MAEPTIKVTKLDAAKRQLRTAIKLWFMDGDPVSIHTLVSAAHEIVHTLFKRKGLRGLIFDSNVIVDEHRGEFAKLVKAHATFFKHAQRDPDGEIDFNPRTNENLLLFTVHGLERMGEPLGDDESTFMTWFSLHHPNLFLKNALVDSLPVDLLQEVRRIEKDKFFETWQLKLRENSRA